MIPWKYIISLPIGNPILAHDTLCICRRVSVKKILSINPQIKGKTELATDKQIAIPNKGAFMTARVR